MDTDKVNEAAEKELANTFSADVLEYVVAKNTFIKGANWLMQQPLSDRLTKEEKERIKDEYAINKYWYNQCQNSEWDERFDQCRAEGAMSMLETLFGSDFFKGK